MSQLVRDIGLLKSARFVLSFAKRRLAKRGREIGIDFQVVLHIPLLRGREHLGGDM